MTRIVHINDHRVQADPTGICCVCGKPGATLADLDGDPPSGAFYHAECLSDEE